MQRLQLKFSCSSVLLLVVSLFEAASAACNQYYFPHSLGGISGDTQIQAMDVYNDLIAVAGASQDSGLVSTAGSPFLAVISAGNVYEWSNVYTRTGDSFVMVSFSPTGTYVAALTLVPPIWVIIVNAVDGTSYQELESGPTWILSQPRLSDVFVDSSYFMLAITTSTNNFLVLSFLLPTIYLRYSVETGFAATIAQCSDSSKKYVGGTQQGVPTLSILTDHAVLSRNYQFSTTYSYPNQYVNRIVSENVGSFFITDQVFGSILIDPGSANIVQVFSAGFDPLFAIYSVKLLQLSLPFMDTLDVYVISQTQIGVVMVDTNNNAHYVMIDFSSETGTAMSASLFTSATQTLTGGGVTANFGPLIAGYTDNYASSIVRPTGYSFSYNIGFVNAFDSVNRCQGGAYATSLSSLSISYSSSSLISTLSFTMSTFPSFSWYFTSASSSAFLDVQLLNYKCDALPYYTISGYADEAHTVFIGQMQNFTRQTFTATCSADITYTVTLNSSLSDPGTVSASTLSYDDITGAINYKTNDRSLDGKTVVIYVQAFIRQSQQYAYYLITLTLQRDICELAVVTAGPVSDVTYDITYGDGFYLNDLSYTSTNSGTCPVQYLITATNSAGAVVATFSTITSMKMYTSGITTAPDTLNIVVRYFVKNQTLTNTTTTYYTLNRALTFKIFVVDLCTVNYAVPPTTISATTINYQQRLYIPLDPWTPYTSYCNSTIVYSLTNLPSFCILSFMQLDCYPVSDPSDIGVFYYQIVATIGSIAKSYNTSITVLQQVFPYTVPAETFAFFSYFVLVDQAMTAGNTLQQSLFINSVLQSQFQMGFTLSVNFGSAVYFSSFTGSKNVFTPDLVDPGGVFKIILNVKSKTTGIIYSANYKLTVNPYDPDADTDTTTNSTNSTDGTGGNGTNSTDGSSSGGTGSGSGGFGGSGVQEINFKKFRNIKSSYCVSATMGPINRYGVFTIYFNDTMMTPKNATILERDQTLQIQVINGLSNKVDPYTQNVTKFTVLNYLTRSLQIQVEFSNPKIISQFSVSLYFVQADTYRQTFSVSNFSRTSTSSTQKLAPQSKIN